MTLEDKIEKLKISISPDTADEDVLISILDDAKHIIIQRRFSMTGYDENTKMPPCYDNLQIRIAVQLFSKRGAEGQITHTENGISRGYSAAEVSNDLLKQIIPLVGGVLREETSDA